MKLRHRKWASELQSVNLNQGYRYMTMSQPYKVHLDLAPSMVEVGIFCNHGNQPHHFSQVNADNTRRSSPLLKIERTTLCQVLAPRRAQGTGVSIPDLYPTCSWVKRTPFYPMSFCSSLFSAQRTWTGLLSKRSTFQRWQFWKRC